MDICKVIKWRNLFPSLLLLTFSTHSSAILSALDDVTLSGQIGQAVFYTDYIAPGTLGAPAVNNGIGFFTLGLNSTVELNANISRLQLGCGGVNGPGACDIDMSQVRFTGNSPGPSGTYADSNGIVTNPFIQLAIKNPTSLSTREVVGFNFGSQKINALVSIGLNPTPEVSGIGGGQTGIKTISGSFIAQVTGLNTPTTVCLGTSNATNSACGIGFPFLNGTSTISGGNCVGGTGYCQFVSGQRLSSTKIGPIPLSTGLLGGLFTTKIDTIVDQNLLDIHNLQAVSTPDAGLSFALSRQPILYPQIGTLGISTFSTELRSTSQTGWWMNIPQTNIDLSDNPTGRAYVGTFEALGGIINIPLNLASLNLGQIPVQNCYNGLKFC